jgi:hypothetical protein
LKKTHWVLILVGIGVAIWLYESYFKGSNAAATALTNALAPTGLQTTGGLSTSTIATSPLATTTIALDPTLSDWSS